MLYHVIFSDSSFPRISNSNQISNHFQRTKNRRDMFHLSLLMISGSATSLTSTKTQFNGAHSFEEPNFCIISRRSLALLVSRCIIPVPPSLCTLFRIPTLASSCFIGMIEPNKTGLYCFGESQFNAWRHDTKSTIRNEIFMKTRQCG